MSLVTAVEYQLVKIKLLTTTNNAHENKSCYEMAIPTQLKIYTAFSRPLNNLKMMLGWVFLYPYPLT